MKGGFAQVQNFRATTPCIAKTYINLVKSRGLESETFIYFVCRVSRAESSAITTLYSYRYIYVVKAELSRPSPNFILYVRTYIHTHTHTYRLIDFGQVLCLGPFARERLLPVTLLYSPTPRYPEEAHFSAECVARQQWQVVENNPCFVAIHKGMSDIV